MAYPIFVTPIRSASEQLRLSILQQAIFVPTTLKLLHDYRFDMYMKLCHCFSFTARKT